MSEHEKTLKFIEDYREISGGILWNVQRNDYRNKTKRTSAISKLASKYLMTPKEVKNKIKSLRSYFSKEHARVTKRNRSGPKLAYESSWFAYQPLMFILDSMTKERKDVCSENVRPSENFGDLDAAADAGTSGENNDNNAVSQHDQAPELVKFESDDSDSSNSDLDTNVPEIVMGGKQAASSPPDTSSKKRKLLSSMDECDVFASHIAVQLKNLTTPSCILAQQDIQTVLTRYRMTDLRLPKFVLDAINGSPEEEQERVPEVSRS